MFISNAYAQAAAGAGGLESSLTSFLPIILMFVVLYFLLIRPQMRRQKEQKTMMEALGKGLALEPYLASVVLGGGALPLNELELRIDGWIASVAAGR